MLGIRRIGNNCYVVFQLSFASFQDLTIVLSTLLPVISMNSENKRHSGSSVGRKVSHWSLPFYVVNAMYIISGLFHFCSLYFGSVVYKSFAYYLSLCCRHTMKCSGVFWLLAWYTPRICLHFFLRYGHTLFDGFALDILYICIGNSGNNWHSY